MIRSDLLGLPRIDKGPVSTRDWHTDWPHDPSAYGGENPDENVGVFKREGKDFYRIRTGDIRIYFEARGKNQLYSHFILHKNTMADFMFRCKLPLDNESAAEQDKGFWKYIEGLTRK